MLLTLTVKHSQYFLRQEDFLQWQPVKWPFDWLTGSAVTRGLVQGYDRLRKIEKHEVHNAFSLKNIQLT